MKRVYATFAIAAAVVCLLTSPASAGTIQIQLAGLNARYNGFDLYDAGSQLGGSQNPGQSDPLTSIAFLVDGVPVGSLATQVFADFAIVGVNNLPTGGGNVTSTFGGFFDVLTSPLGWGLGLDFNSFQVAYNSAAASITGTGTAAIVSGQALPFGLLAGNPVQLSFVLGLTDVTSSGGFVTSFTGAGTGQITAATIPEPAVLLLLVTGGGALIGRRQRGRRSEHWRR